MKGYLATLVFTNFDLRTLYRDLFVIHPPLFTTSPSPKLISYVVNTSINFLTVPHSKKWMNFVIKHVAREFCHLKNEAADVEFKHHAPGNY